MGRSGNGNYLIRRRERMTKFDNKSQVRLKYKGLGNDMCNVPYPFTVNNCWQLSENQQSAYSI